MLALGQLPFATLFKLDFKWAPTKDIEEFNVVFSQINYDDIFGFLSFIDSYSALQHKRARFQDFADMLSTCNLWSQDYGATWRGHNANKLFIRYLFEVEVSLDTQVAMFV